MLTEEQKKQFSEILEELGNTLDITETQYNAAIKSYRAVGSWLAKEDSVLAPYSPEILPQGSFMIGTIIQPVHDNDDLDIDLGCQLKGKNPNWTQKDLKDKVGAQLSTSEIYKNMLEEKRRCWTLHYRQDASTEKEKYHMDILPAIVDSGYQMIIEKAFTATELKDIDTLALRITDNTEFNYAYETNHLNWMKSNPFGYGRWFYQQATIDFVKSFSINESVKPVPVFKKEKLPLQRVVQILKRHRDMMYKDRKDRDNKPISIIITTLAARAYNKETDIIDALINVISKMRYYIQDKNPHTGANEKWISNPVNDEENFADKWTEYPARETNFFQWLDAVEQDVANIIAQKGKGLQLISESMSKPFGKELITKAFSNYGENLLKKRESGALKMAAGTGIIGNIGRTVITQHQPFGANE